MFTSCEGLGTSWKDRWPCKLKAQQRFQNGGRSVARGRYNAKNSRQNTYFVGFRSIYTMCGICCCLFVDNEKSRSHYQVWRVNLIFRCFDRSLVSRRNILAGDENKQRRQLEDTIMLFIQILRTNVIINLRQSKWRIWYMCRSWVND